VGRAARRVLFACLCSLAVVPAACSTTGNKAKQDPLFGVNPPNPNSSPPAAVPRSKNEVSSAPSATGPNLASLAGLPDSRPLSISQPETTPDARPSTGATALASTPKATTGASLSAPVPVVQPVPRAGEDPIVPASSWDKGQPAGATTSSGATSLPVPSVAAGIQVPQPSAAAPPAAPVAGSQQQPVNDPFLDQLRARGVTWQKAQNVAGGVSFSCIVPNRHNPEVTRTYEAIGPDYPAAVRAVLWKIDKDQK